MRRGGFLSLPVVFSQEMEKKLNDQTNIQLTRGNNLIFPQCPCVELPCHQCLISTPLCVCVCVLQGTPEFVDVSECVHYFEWKTYVACRRDKFKPHKEVCTCCCDDDDDDEEDGGSWV